MLGLVLDLNDKCTNSLALVGNDRTALQPAANQIAIVKAARVRRNRTLCPLRYDLACFGLQLVVQAKCQCFDALRPNVSATRRQQNRALPRLATPLATAAEKRARPQRMLL